MNENSDLSKIADYVDKVLLTLVIGFSTGFFLGLVIIRYIG